MTTCPAWTTMHCVAASQLCTSGTTSRPPCWSATPCRRRLLSCCPTSPTNSMLRAAILLGAYSGKLLSVDEAAALEMYSDAIGLAFQVVDDILDATADSATLGKTAGKDAADNKPTYVSILGLAESQALAEKLRGDGHRALEQFGDNALRLHELADLIVQRKA